MLHEAKGINILESFKLVPVSSEMPSTSKWILIFSNLSATSGQASHKHVLVKGSLRKLVNSELCGLV